VYTRMITYKDLDENDVTETFQFHLNKVEAMEFAAEWKGTPAAILGEAFAGMRSGDEEGKHESIILRFFRDLVALSVGHRSASGKSFTKTDEITSEFMQSDAYVTFFYELVSNEKVATDFVNNVFPKEVAEQLAAASKVTYTDEQLLNMSDAEFTKIVGNPHQMTREHLMLAVKRKNRTSV
jgi:hypothetical protein